MQFVFGMVLVLLGAFTPQDSIGSLSLVRVVVSDSGGMTAERIVDAAVGTDGSIYVLRAGGSVQRLLVNGEVKSWGGRGTEDGKFWRPTGLAVGSPDSVYVYDEALSAITVFDSSGAFIRRVILPVRLTAFVDMRAGTDGTVFLSAYGEDTRPAQIFVLKPGAKDAVLRLGVLRPTRDSLATRFFQGGFLSISGDSVFFAGLNPFRIERYDYRNGTYASLSRGNLLTDGESVAFKHLHDDQICVTNRFPQSTGLARLPNGDLVYTAFFPRDAHSVLEVLTAEGHVKLRAELPTLFRVRDVLPNGDLLVIRAVAREELAEYRIE